jgi:hypothetical protein
MLIHHFSISESHVLGAPLEPREAAVESESRSKNIKGSKEGGAARRVGERSLRCVRGELQSGGLAVIAFSKTLSKSHSAGPVSRCHF